MMCNFLNNFEILRHLRCRRISLSLKQKMGDKIEFIRIFESYYLFEVEIMKSKLASRGIESYIKNNFINNVVLMPVNQFYILYVNQKDAEEALTVVNEISE